MIHFEAPTEAQLEDLKAKHGEIVEVEDSGRVFVVAKAANPRATLQRFTSLAGTDAKKLEAFESLAKAAVVHPEKDTLKRVLDDEPGLVFTLGEKAGELLGLRQASAKKG